MSYLKRGADKSRIHSLWQYNKTVEWWPVRYHEQQAERLMQTYTYHELREMATPLGLDIHLSKHNLAICIVAESLIFFPDEVGAYAHETLVHMVKHFRLLPQYADDMARRNLSKGELQKALLDAWRGGSIEDMHINLAHVTDLREVMEGLEKMMCKETVKSVLRKDHGRTPSLHTQVERTMTEVVRLCEQWQGEKDQSKRRDLFVLTREANIRAEQALTSYLKIIQKHCRVNGTTCAVEDMPPAMQRWLTSASVNDKYVLCNVRGVKGAQVKAGLRLGKNYKVYLVETSRNEWKDKVVWAAIGQSATAHTDEEDEEKDHEEDEKQEKDDDGWKNHLMSLWRGGVVKNMTRMTTTGFYTVMSALKKPLVAAGIASAPVAATDVGSINLPKKPDLPFAGRVTPIEEPVIKDWNSLWAWCEHQTRADLVPVLIGAYHFPAMPLLTHVAEVLGPHLPLATTRLLRTAGGGGNQFMRGDPVFLNELLRRVRDLVSKQRTQMEPSVVTRAMSEMKSIPLWASTSVLCTGPVVLVRDTYAHAREVVGSAPMPHGLSLTQWINMGEKDDGSSVLLPLALLLDQALRPDSERHLAKTTDDTHLMLFPNVNTIWMSLNTLNDTRKAQLQPFHATFMHLEQWLTNYAADDMQTAVPDLIMIQGEVSDLQALQRTARDNLRNFGDCMQERLQNSAPSNITRRLDWCWRYLTLLAQTPALVPVDDEETQEMYTVVPDFEAIASTVDGVATNMKQVLSDLKSGLTVVRQYKSTRWLAQWSAPPRVRFATEDISSRLSGVKATFPDYSTFLVQQGDVTMELLDHLIEVATKEVCIGPGLIPDVVHVSKQVRDPLFRAKLYDFFPTESVITPQSTIVPAPHLFPNSVKKRIEYDSAYVALGIQTSLSSQSVMMNGEPIDDHTKSFVQSQSKGGVFGADGVPFQFAGSSLLTSEDLVTVIRPHLSKTNRPIPHKLLHDWSLAEDPDPLNSNRAVGDRFFVRLIKSFLHHLTLEFKVNPSVPVEHFLLMLISDIASESVPSLNPYFHVWRHLQGDVETVTRLVFTASIIEDHYRLVYHRQLGRFVLVRLSPCSARIPLLTLHAMQLDPLVGETFLVDPQTLDGNLMKLWFKGQRLPSRGVVVGEVNTEDHTVRISLKGGSTLNVSGQSLWRGAAQHTPYVDLQHMAVQRTMCMMRALLEHGSSENFQQAKWVATLRAIASMLQVSTNSQVSVDLLWNIMKTAQDNVVKKGESWKLKDEDLKKLVVDVFRNGSDPLSLRIHNTPVALIPSSKLWVSISRSLHAPELWDAASVVMRRVTSDQWLSLFQEFIAVHHAPLLEVCEPLLVQASQSGADPLINFLLMIPMISGECLIVKEAISESLAPARLALECRGENWRDRVVQSLGQPLNDQLLLEMEECQPRIVRYVREYGAAGVLHLAIARHVTNNGTLSTLPLNVAIAVLATWRMVYRALAMPPVASTDRELFPGQHAFNQGLPSTFVEFLTTETSGRQQVNTSSLQRLLQGALLTCSNPRPSTSLWQEQCEAVRVKVTADSVLATNLLQAFDSLAKLSQSIGDRSSGQFWRGLLPTSDERGRFERMVKDMLVPPEQLEWSSCSPSMRGRHVFRTKVAPGFLRPLWLTGNTEEVQPLQTLMESVAVNTESSLVPIHSRLADVVWLQQLLPPKVVVPSRKGEDDLKVLQKHFSSLSTWLEQVKNSADAQRALATLVINHSLYVEVELVLGALSFVVSTQSPPPPGLMARCPVAAWVRVEPLSSQLRLMGHDLDSAARQFFLTSGWGNIGETCVSIWQLPGTVLDSFLIQSSSDLMAAVQGLIQGLTGSKRIETGEVKQFYQLARMMVPRGDKSVVSETTWAALAKGESPPVNPDVIWVTQSAVLSRTPCTVMPNVSDRLSMMNGLVAMGIRIRQGAVVYAGLGERLRQALETRFGFDQR